MGYAISKGTVRWARTRVQQLEEARVEIGCAIERLEGIPSDLKGGAILMENQPESDVMISFADDISKTLKDLKKAFSAMEKDLKALRTGIRKYEVNNHD